MRAVNQAAGRVIRHKDDFGAVVLIEQRYHRNDYKSRISKWMKDRIIFNNNLQFVTFEIEKMVNKGRSLMQVNNSETNLESELDSALLE